MSPLSNRPSDPRANDDRIYFSCLFCRKSLFAIKNMSARAKKTVFDVARRGTVDDLLHAISWLRQSSSYSFNINMVDRRSNVPVTLLAIAVERENIEMVDALLACKGIKCDAGTPPPLEYALRKNRADIVARLLDSGADVNLFLHHGKRPLHFQCDLLILRMLLERGANPNIRDLRSNTPLHCHIFSTEHVRVVLQHGADVNAKGRGCLTPLFSAVVIPDGASLPTCKLLVEYGADVSAYDMILRATVLDYVCTWAPNSAVIAFLIACGARLSTVDPLRVLPLATSALLAAIYPIANDAKSIPAADLEGARRQIARSRVDLIRQRATDICVALYSLHLSACEHVAIIEFACEPFSNCVPLHHKWRIATLVKHFVK